MLPDVRGVQHIPSFHIMGLVSWKKNGRLSRCLEYAEQQSPGLCRRMLRYDTREEHIVENPLRKMLYLKREKSTFEQYHTFAYS